MMRIEGFPAPAGVLAIEAERGDVVLLRGPNGSGKTSFLRALAGLHAPLAPTDVSLDGDDPRALPSAALARRATLCPQDARDALVGLTVAGELRLRGLLDKHPLEARDSAALSSGEARRLCLSIASARGTPVLLLDEPVEGLDAAGRESLRALVRDASERGVVVAADHAGVLDDLATRVVDLGAAHDAQLAPLPRAGGEVVVRAERAAARGVELPAVALPAGFHVVRGANGAGKSTLLLRLAGLLDAEDVRVRGARPAPGTSVRLALPHAKDAMSRERVGDEVAACDAQVRDALVPSTLTGRHPMTLSGGEAQRVSLAKCLGSPAPLYLLDEPEAHLDGEGRAALVRVVARRVAEGACVLAATHDRALQALAHETIEMEARA